MPWSQFGINCRNPVHLRAGLLAVIRNIPFPLPRQASLTHEFIYQVQENTLAVGTVGEDQDAAYRVKVAGWLIERGPAVFYERRPQTWKDLWHKYFWYGYGNYELYLKNRNIFVLHKMIPIAGFVAGALYILDAYRLTCRKSVFWLPLHYAFKMTAWCFGFAKSKADFSSTVR